MDLYFLIFTVFFIQSYSAKGEEINLDYYARQRAERMAQRCGTTVRWYDLHGKQPHLKEQYPDMKIDARVDGVKYKTVSRKVDRPGYTFKQWFHNGQSVPITGIIHKQKSVASTFTWSVTESLKVGAEVSIDVGVPEVVSGNIKLTTELNLASTQEKTETSTDTFTVSQEIIIPAKTSLKAIVTITETEVEVPWTATMHVTGYEAIWLEDKCNDHWLWFAPIEQLADYSPKLKPGMTPYGDGFSFETQGVFKSVQALRAVVHTKEYPYMGLPNFVRG